MTRTHIPMDNQELFSRLASIGEPQLMSVAAALARGRDLSALQDLVDFLKEDGASLPSLKNSAGFDCALENAAFEAPGGTSLEHFTFPRVFIHSVRRYNQRDEQTPGACGEPLTPAELGLVERATTLAGFYKEWSPLESNMRVYMLEVMLFQAASSATDPRLFKLIFESGAKGNVQEISNAIGQGSSACTPIEEALASGNIYGAAALVAHMGIELVEKFMLDWLQNNGAGPEPQAFRKHETTQQVLRFLAPETFAGLGLFLENLEKRLAADLPVQSDPQRLLTAMSVVDLRIQLLAIYLERATEANVDWDETVVTGLAGADDKGLDAANSPIAKRLDEEITRYGARGRSLWAHGKSATGAIQRKMALADLLQQAVTAHCTPVMDLLTPLMARSSEDGPGFEEAIGIGRRAQALAAQQGDTAPNMSRSRFNATVERLVAHGHDVNRVQVTSTGDRALHQATVLHPEAIGIVVPALLAAGADPETVNTKGQKARDLVPASIDEAWRTIEHAFAAHATANALLATLGAGTGNQYSLQR